MKRAIWGLPLLPAVAGLLFLVLGAGAATCRFAVNCHLRGGQATVTPETFTPEYFETTEDTATTLAPGLVQELVLGGLDYPVDVAPLPDGGFLVAERLGVIKLASADGKTVRTILDLQDAVGTYSFRGLVVLRTDPSFATSRLFYVVYANEDGGTDKATTVTIERFRLGADEATTRRSGRVVVGAVRSGSCYTPGADSDCLPAEGDHIGADIVFAPDETLFISTGDGTGTPEQQATALDPDRLNGKILHVDSNGNGLAQNPWWTGDPADNRSKVWAVGLRNPFRATRDARNGTLVVGDVGQGLFEEIDVVFPGDNLGWPCFEGRRRGPRRFSALPACDGLAFAQTRRPLLVYEIPPTASVTGGAFWDPGDGGDTSAYVFGDWARGTLRSTRISSTGDSATPPRLLAEPASGPTAIRVAQDGSLLYVAANVGEVRRIRRQ